MNPVESHHFRWVWIGLAIMLVLIGAAFFVSVVFQNGSSPFSNSGFGWWPLLGLFFLFFWGFSWFFPWRHRYWGYHYWRDEDPAFQMLRERYARGEITKEVFDQMTRDLERHRLGQ